MKRSFILLLVVALLATMIPSFALADEAKAKPTVAFSAKEQKFVLPSDRWPVPEKEWPSLKVEGVEEGKGTRLLLESSDTKVVSIIGDYREKSDVSDFDQGLYSYITIKTAGEATITATLYDKDDKKIGESATIKVTVTKKPIDKITVKEEPEQPIKIMEGSSTTVVRDMITVDPDDAYYRYSLDWSSADESIAVVSNKGEVKGVKAGTTTVYAKDPDGKAKAAEIKISVEAKAPEDEYAAPKLSFTTKKFTLKNTDNKFEIEKYLKVDGLSWNDSIVWKSSDPETISVYQTRVWVGYDEEWDEYIYEDRYVLSLNKPGSVTITAYSNKFPEASAECEVTYDDPLKSITIKGQPKTMEEGSQLYLNNYIVVDPYDFDVSKLEWTSSDPQVAYVQNGWLFAQKAGTEPITITASYGDVPPASFTIEVKPKPVDTVSFTKDEFDIRVGETLKLADPQYLVVKPTEHGDVTAVWTSSDEEVATVSNYEGRVRYIGNVSWGQVIALKAGEATITLTVRNADGGDPIVAKTKVIVTGAQATGIAFKKEAYTVKCGKTAELALAVTPADGALPDDLYAESSDTNVVKINYLMGDTVGIRAIKPGTSTITVVSRSNPDLKATVPVTVKASPLEDVAFAKDSIEVTYYEKADVAHNETDIDFVFRPSDAYVEATWQTSDPDVAYVIDEDNDGRDLKLVATGYGECEITVTATDGTTTKTATLKVKVTKPKTSVKLVLDQTVVKGYMVRGEKNAVVLKATDKNTGAAVPVTWKTSNKKVATVSKKGVVKFKSAGKAVITATTTDGKQTATCNFTIYKLPVRQIARSNRVLTVKLGEKVKLNLKVKPAKAYNPALAFKSSDPKTVAVSKQGYVKGLKVGKAVITITAKDGSGVETTMTIKVVPSTAHNDELIDDTAETLTIDGDLAVDLGSFDDLITDDTEDDAGEITEVTIE